MISRAVAAGTLSRMAGNHGKATMQAIAQRKDSFRHTVRIRDHHVIIDEPQDAGGDDAGPSPQELLAASLASCTAITMEMYAARKGWDIGYVEVECDYSPAERGCPTRFELIMRFPDTASEEQVERLRVIAAKCPVHRTLDGEVMFAEHVERLQLA
jgi:putative redox protein